MQANTWVEPGQDANVCSRTDGLTPADYFAARHAYAGAPARQKRGR